MYKGILYKGEQANVYGTPGSAGVDLIIEEDLVLKPGEKVTLDTSYTLDIPANWYGNLTTRSSVSIKHDIILLPTNAVIDSDYKDNIKLCLKNIGDETQKFKAKDRVAQIVLHEYNVINPVYLTSKRTGGIGSTNKKN